MAKPMDVYSWQEFQDWCKRVQRDILALEVWAKQCECGAKFMPGGSDDQKGKALDNRIAVLKGKKGGKGGDPGDPPRGPFG